jgi:hypothetical protein
VQPGKLVLTSALLFTVAHATPPTGNRADQRLDRRGDRIDRRRGVVADFCQRRART